MAEIESRLLGTVEASEEKLYHFNGTILGFEDYDEFYLLDMDNDGTFKVLQSKDNKDTSFILIDPFTVFSDYRPDIHDDDIKSLQIEKESDILLLTIITVPNEDFKQMTANLLGPVVFNLRLHKGKQCIAIGDTYNTRHYVISEYQEADKG